MFALISVYVKLAVFTQLPGRSILQLFTDVHRTHFVGLCVICLRSKLNNIPRYAIRNKCYM